MESNFFDYDLNKVETVLSFESFRHGEILKHLLKEDALDWLMNEYSSQLMRFGLTAEMGEIDIEIDETLKGFDPLKAFTSAWVKSLARTWPLDADFHGIPLNPLVKPVLLKSLLGMSTVDAVFEDLDCIVQHFEDSEINLALLKIKGSAVEEMSIANLSKQHYFAALANSPEVLGSIDDELLDRELVDFACQRIPSVILKVDPKWQTQENIDACLMDGLAPNNLKKVRPEFLNSKNILKSIECSPYAYCKLPGEYQCHEEIIKHHLKYNPSQFRDVPPDYVTLDVLARAIAKAPVNAQYDLSHFGFSMDDILIETCKIHDGFLNHAKNEFLTDKVLDEVIKRKPLSIGYLNERLPNIKRHYINAVMKDALAITYVPQDRRKEILHEVRLKRQALANDSPIP